MKNSRFKIIFISLILFLSCQANESEQYIRNKLNVEEWNKRTLSEIYSSCNIENITSFYETKGLILNINGKDIATLEGHIDQILKTRDIFFKELLSNFQAIQFSSKKGLTIIEVHRLSSDTEFIVFSNSDRMFRLEFKKNKFHFLKLKEEEEVEYYLKGNVNKKCVNKANSFIQRLEVYTKIIFDRDKVDYDTQFIYID